MKGTISNWSRTRRTKQSPCRLAIGGVADRVSLYLRRLCERADAHDESCTLDLTYADARELRDALDRMLASDVVRPLSTKCDAHTTEPVTTEPVTTEPVTTEPVTTEPVTTEPVTIRTREHYTTNICQLGVVSPLRAKLTATSDGSLVWCELYYADDTLKGCGPSLVGLPSDLHDAAIARLSTPAAGWPMYWSRG